jgi:hypothetical protein
MSLIQEILRNGEMKLWHDYSSGSLADLSGNGNDGAFVNSPFINRNGVSTNGTDNYIQVGDDDSLSFGDGSVDSPFSLVVWVHEIPSQTYLIHKTEDSTSAANLEYIFRTDATGRLAFFTYDASASAQIGQYASVGSEIEVGKSYILIGTYDGSSTSAGMKIYANGVLVPSALNEAGVYVAMENLAKNVGIGRRGSSYSKAVYEQVMIMGRELDATEAAKLTGELLNKKY